MQASLDVAVILSLITFPEGMCAEKYKAVENANCEERLLKTFYTHECMKSATIN